MVRQGSPITEDPVLSALKASRWINDEDLGFLRRLGRAFDAGVLPSGIRMREPGECFAVARELAHDGWGVYTRGFALRHDSTEPLAHAWVSNDDTALDASWPGAAKCSYWGVCGMRYEEALKRMSKPFLRRDIAFGFLFQRPASPGIRVSPVSRPAGADPDMPDAVARPPRSKIG